MQEIAVTKFKATCLSVLESVRKTRKPVRITRHGKPIAEVVPAEPAPKKRVLGGMREWTEIVGDIVGPVGAFEGLKKRRRKIL
ncbi:MAG TPA: type II toxin-antitoxin system Phd/YefM family antitoxin [Verrucomicrobiae bacterium]|nr:type II toxin-antitoxin system Phd/YefM family antitoxin [Verrucomicrobiae bacterium]